MESLEDRSLMNVTPLGPEFRVNTYTTRDQATNFAAPQAVAMDDAGNFVVVWQSDSQDGQNFGVFGQRFNAVGTPQGNEFRVNTTTDNAQERPVVAMDADGDFVVAWTSTGQDESGSLGVYARRYDETGTPLSGEFRVNSSTTGNQFGPSIAMDDAGNFVITWTSGNSQDGNGIGVFGQRYDSGGGLQGGEFQVNVETDDRQESSNVAMDADGDFVVTWSSLNQDGDSYGIYAQRYSKTGVPQGEFQVNTYTTKIQWVPVVAMDADGDFVISWWDKFRDSGYGVYAQRYNAAGQTQGNEFQVNTYKAGNQYYPRIGMQSNGDFVVTWQSDGQDGSAGGIYLQSYDATGTPQGPEARVNTTTANGQSDAGIAMGPNGNFVIVWTSRNQDGSGDGVYARRFGPNQAPTKTSISNVSVSEDAVDTVVDLSTSFADADLALGAPGFTYTVESNTNSGLFTSVTFDGDDLTLDYAPDANGTATLKIRATDAGGEWVEATFDVGVAAVNDSPSFTKGANQTVNSKAGAQSVTGWATNISAGASNESAQQLTFQIVGNTNTGLFSSGPAIASDGTLTFAPVPGITGSATITVQLADDGGGTDTSATQQFTITVDDTAPTASYDFQPGSLPLYQPSLGYGWTKAPTGYDSGVVPVLAGNPLEAQLRDGVAGTGAGTENAGIFRLDFVSADPVQITALLGRAGVSFDRVEVAYSTNGTAFRSLTTGALSIAADTFVSVSSSVRFPAGLTPGLQPSGVYSLWIRFMARGRTSPGWAVAGLEVRSVTNVESLAVLPPAGPLTADGTTLDTFSISGASPGAVLTIKTTRGGGTIVTDDYPELVGTQVTADKDGTATFQIRRPTRQRRATITVTDFTGEALGSVMVEYLKQPRRGA